MWPFKEKLKIPVRSLVSIRMEAIGGQGANTAGKILAEAAVLGEGFTGNHFSSFGSEKRGSPVKSFVRFSPEKKPVRSASAIQNPNLLVIFHDALLESHQEVLEGCGADTDLIINTSHAPSDLPLSEGLIVRQLATLDASALTRKYECGLNAVMLGAMSKLTPEIGNKTLEETLVHFFSRLPKKALNANQKGFWAGHEKVSVEKFDPSWAKRPARESLLPEIGWKNAPLGGVIINPGNTVLKDQSASRKGVAPKFFKDICFNCGYCDMVCPDFCFVWKLDPSGSKTPELQGIDYQYCKGCQKCVTVCPVEALVPVAEDQISSAERAFHVFPELKGHESLAGWKKSDLVLFSEELAANPRSAAQTRKLLDARSYIRPDFSGILKKKLEKK